MTHLSSRLRITILLLVLLNIGLYVSLLATAQLPPAPITWTPASLQAEVLAGSVTTLDVQIQSQVALSRGRLVVAAPVPGIVSVPSGGYTGSVQAGQPYPVHLDVQVPAVNPRPYYAATVSLRSERFPLPGVTLLQSLPVLISVRQPSAHEIPTHLSRPSPDRIATLANGLQIVRDELAVVLDFDTPNPDLVIIAIAQATGAVIMGSVPQTLTYQLRYPATAAGDLDAIRSTVANFEHVEVASESPLGRPINLD